MSMVVAEPRLASGLVVFCGFDGLDRGPQRFQPAPGPQKTRR